MVRHLSWSSFAVLPEKSSAFVLPFRKAWHCSSVGVFTCPIFLVSPALLVSATSFSSSMLGRSTRLARRFLQGLPAAFLISHFGRHLSGAGSISWRCRSHASCGWPLFLLWRLLHPLLPPVSRSASASWLLSYSQPPG